MPLRHPSHLHEWYGVLATVVRKSTAARFLSKSALQRSAEQSKLWRREMDLRCPTMFTAMVRWTSKPRSRVRNGRWICCCTSYGCSCTTKFGSESWMMKRVSTTSLRKGLLLLITLLLTATDVLAQDNFGFGSSEPGESAFPFPGVTTPVPWIRGRVRCGLRPDRELGRYGRSYAGKERVLAIQAGPSARPERWRGGQRSRLGPYLICQSRSWWTAASRHTPTAAMEDAPKPA